MLKKALEYLVGLDKPNLVELNGATFCDKNLERVVTDQYADCFRLTTLSSLVDYIKSNVDEMKGHMFVHVESPTMVSLFSQLDGNREREHVVKVIAQLPEIATDTYVEREKFNVALQSKFVDNADREVLLSFVSCVESGTVAEYGDNGVSQKATVKTGIVSKSEVIVPNPVVLKPFRTFTEIDQPESAFVFRVKQDKYDDDIKCALFEADGGAWRAHAMCNIKDYLTAALADVEGYTIIS